MSDNSLYWLGLRGSLDFETVKATSFGKFPENVNELVNGLRCCKDGLTELIRDILSFEDEEMQDFGSETAKCDVVVVKDERS